MKKFFIFFFISMFGTLLHAQSRFIFPELDKSLLNVWIVSQSHGVDALETSILKTENEWLNIKDALAKEKVDNYNMKSFTHDLSYLVELMKRDFENEKYGQIQGYAEHFLWEFRTLRRCSFIEYYPLDQLWDVYDIYKEVHYTIDDPMFGLREWAEFELLVNDLIKAWENYELIHDGQLIEYYTAIDFNAHKQTKAKISNCILELVASFESGYRTDYQLPCDELDMAFMSLFTLYTKATITPGIVRGIL